MRFATLVVLTFLQNGVSVYVDTSAGETSSEVEEAFHMCATLALQARADTAR